VQGTLNLFRGERGREERKVTIRGRVEISTRRGTCISVLNSPEETRGGGGKREGGVLEAGGVKKTGGKGSSSETVLFSIGGELAFIFFSYWEEGKGKEDQG